MSIKEIIKFDIKRSFSSLLVISILPISLLLILVLYFYLIFSGAILTTSNQKEILYLVARMFAFILQFILSIYSIIVGTYLLDDSSMSFIITSLGSRRKPYLARIVSTSVLLTLVNITFLTIFYCFSFIFITPPSLGLILVFFSVGSMDILTFSSITFLGYILIKMVGIRPVLSSLVPLSILFVLPQFLYNGISVGILPTIFYSLTLQFHLSTIANYLIPSPYIIPVATDLLLVSLITISICVVSTYVSGLVLAKFLEYQ